MIAQDVCGGSFYPGRITQCGNQVGDPGGSRTAGLLTIRCDRTIPNVWWQLKAGLAFHFGRSIKRIIRYVWPLPSNNPGRGACAALSYSDPTTDRIGATRGPAALHHLPAFRPLRLTEKSGELTLGMLGVHREPAQQN